MSGTEKMLLLIAGLVLILVGMGLTGFWSRASMSRKSKPDLTQFSKWVVADVRPLLWVVTIGGFALAFYCVYKGFTGALPWIGAMVGLPWTAHGVICAAYLSLCKSDDRRGGTTYDAAKAAYSNVPQQTQEQEPEGSVDSPAI